MTYRKGSEVVREIDRAEQRGHKRKAEELRKRLNNEGVAAAHRSIKTERKHRAQKELSPAKLADELKSKYVAPLVRGIDKLAKINGGKGKYHETCEEALNTLLKALREMRSGKR